MTDGLWLRNPVRDTSFPSLHHSLKVVSNVTSSIMYLQAFLGNECLYGIYIANIKSYFMQSLIDEEFS